MWQRIVSSSCPGNYKVDFPEILLRIPSTTISEIILRIRYGVWIRCTTFFWDSSRNFLKHLVLLAFPMEFNLNYSGDSTKIFFGDSFKEFLRFYIQDYFFQEILFKNFFNMLFWRFLLWCLHEFIHFQQFLRACFSKNSWINSSRYSSCCGNLSMHFLMHFFRNCPKMLKKKSRDFKWNFPSLFVCNYRRTPTTYCIKIHPGYAQKNLHCLFYDSFKDLSSDSVKIIFLFA